MSKLCKGVILMLIVSAPLVFCAPSHGVQTSVDDILAGRSIPKNWESAPSTITLPMEWQQTIKELAEETKTTQLEKGACLAFGRSVVEQANMTDRMLQLGKLNRQIKHAQEAGDSVKANQLAAEVAVLKKTLERGGGSASHNVFEVQRVTQGISMSVHIPRCIGSQLGTIHTHPPGLVEFASPSDGDTANSFYHFIEEHHSLEIVARNETVALLLVTQDFIDNFITKGDVTVTKYGEVKVTGGKINKIRPLTYLIEGSVLEHERILSGNPDGVIKKTDLAAARYLSVLAAFLKPYGAVLYSGDMPSVHKVPVATSYQTETFVLRDGRITPVRNFYNTVQLQALWRVHTRVSKDIIGGLNSVNLQVRQLSDSKFLQYLGLNRYENDPRHLLINQSDQVDVGACVYMDGKDSINYHPKCIRTAKKLTTHPCSTVDADNPAIEWLLKNEGDKRVGIYSKEPGRTDVCHAVYYRLNADGSIGSKLNETTIKDF